MASRKYPEKDNEWRKQRKRLLRTGSTESPMLRRFKYTVEPDTGYWHCGSMIYPCRLCSALRYFGEKTNGPGSTQRNPKFSGCCSNGPLTPDFVLSSSCADSFHPSTKTFAVSKSVSSFSEPPKLLRELLTSDSAEARHFRKHIRLYNSALAMASVRADFVRRGPGISKYNPTITVHGRMYHEIGALLPATGMVPRYASVYIHDTERAASNRKHFFSMLREDLLSRLALMLERKNSLVKSFRSLRDLIQNNGIPEDAQLVIHAHEKTMPGHVRKYNVPEANEVAALVVGEQYGKLDIVLRRRSEYDENGFEKLDYINLGHRMYDPLAYPLLFPYGSDGWHCMLRYKDAKGKFQKVSPMKFYSQFLFERSNDFNIIIHCGRLFQQYLCEMFVKVESERLSWQRQNQSKLRASDYTHLCELLADAGTHKNEVNEWTGKRGDHNSMNIGRLVVLPSTHIGGDRYMRQKMHDIIAISNSVGHPDIFITMTCNPHWPEIQEALLTGRRADERPDLCDRVFRMKLKLLLKHLKEDEPFGRISAFVSVIEFQKRGLVHAHIIIFLDEAAKFSLQDPSNIDKLISAEIPSTQASHLRELVLKHMIHNPCSADPAARCMREGKCSKKFPKPFRSETASVEGDYYVSYRRRSPLEGGEFELRTRKTKNRGILKINVDNSWVVPHSPDLLRKFRTHMNVELCVSRVGWIKYLFKYVCKGSDRVTVEIVGGSKEGEGGNTASGVPTIDEIRQYQDARYISASEAAWRLFSYPMVEHEPSVERLEVHLEGHHVVYFEEGDHENAKNTGKEKTTKLLGYFDANRQYSNARHIRYVNFPKYFRWHSTDRKWKPRAKYKLRNTSPTEYDFTTVREGVVGRMYSISPREGERYFLRTLLLHKPGATSFDNLRFHDGVQYSTFRDACCALGLLSDDSEWLRCMQEAFSSNFDHLTEVFTIIMAFCEPANPLRIWEKTKHQMIADFRRRHIGEYLTDELAEAYVLNEIQNSLREISPSLSFKSLNLPVPPEHSYHIDTESTEPVPTTENIESVMSSTKNFNNEQRRVFNTIIGEILPGVTTENLSAHVKRPFNHQCACSRAYFLDAPGGTGKTFTIRAIQSILKVRKHSVIAVATSAVAASLLDGGRTAHSVFKIPIPCYAESVCSITMESTLANEIRHASLIVWDEIVMCSRYCIEAVDRTLRAIMKSPGVPFGGKCILFSGDFRQILPVVPRGSRGMIVFMCFKSSPLYRYVSLLNLTEKMRLQANNNHHETEKAVLKYPEFLLAVGEGRVESKNDSLIELPSTVNIAASSTDLVHSVFENLEKRYNDLSWLTSRAILAPTNSRLKYHNDKVAEWFPGTFSEYKSADSVFCDTLEAQESADLKYPQELLNSIEVGASLSDHEIALKKGFIVMLLRNIKPSAGHANGTRYVVENMTSN